MSEDLFQPAPDAPAPADPVEVEPVEWPTQTLAEGLVALQGRLPRIGKGQTADVKSNSGASYSYQYADLSDVSRALLPVMSSVGLAFTARPTLIDGTLLLAYALVHVSGEREEGIYPLPGGGNPQAIGSAITYARRYCLLAVTGLHPDGEDDDAAAAMPRGGRGQSAPSTPPAPQVDAEWVAEARRRTATATTREQLRTVWDAIGPAADAGRIDQATAARISNEVNDRVAEVDAAAAQAAAETPTPPPAPSSFASVTPETVPDPGPSPWDEPPRPMPTPPPAPAQPAPSVVPAESREQQLADLRDRARRIAAAHDTQTGDDQ